MKQLTKHLLMMLGLLVFMSAQSIAQSKWVPIIMGDITMFVPNTSSVQATKEYYVPNATVTVDVQGYISGDGDWVGIYRKGTSTAWSNVVAWNWVSKNGTISLTKDKKPMPAGEYEVRLFFHNNYVMKAFDSFVVRKYPISTVKATYNANETVSVNVQMTLSGVEDYVGIYPKGSDNSWGNAINWNWVTKNGTVALTRGEGLMPAGEYEVRLFYRNEHGEDAVARATYGFTVSGGGNNYVYGSEGQFMDEVEINSNADFVIYKPRNNVANAPVILYFGMSYAIGDNSKPLRSEGVMRYLASLGCYVIGNKKATTGWTDAAQWPDYTQALVQAQNDGADTSKLGIIGNSAGAMASYYGMKKYKAAGYGDTKSFIIDLHGYHAAGMSKTDLNGLVEVDSLMIAYGGLNGNANESGANQNEDYSEDPRTLLTLSKLLPDTVKKGFIVLETKNHHYQYGEWEVETVLGRTYSAIKDKKDLLAPIDALIKYEWFNGDGKYNDAENILFGDYEEKMQQVYDATMDFIGNDNNYVWKCDDGEGGRHHPSIDYCNDHGLQ